MDYMDEKEIRYYESSDQFFDEKKNQRIILMTTKASSSYTEFKFKKNDTILFGRESAGVPEYVHKMINKFINRIFRAIKIDIDLYEEVEKDKSATFQAGIVVVLSSLAAGVGALQLGSSNFLLAPILSLLS